MTGNQFGTERSLGQLVAQASQDISTLVRSEIALAKLEVQGAAKKAGVGGGLLAAAGVVAFYGVYFLFITIAQVIAIWLPQWASFLIVTLLMFAIAGVLAMIGLKKMKTVNPKPEKAIAQAEQTVTALKSAATSPDEPVRVSSPHGAGPAGSVAGSASGTSSTGSTAVDSSAEARRIG